MQSEVGGHSLAGLPGLSQASVWPSARPTGNPVESTLIRRGRGRDLLWRNERPWRAAFLHPGEGGAFENIPALPDFVCVCVCARTVNFQQLCGRTNPQAEILVLLGFQVSELAEGKASLGGGIHLHLRLPGGLRGGEPSANAGGAGDRDSVPGSGGAPGGGGSNPLQKSRLESSMDRGPGGLQSTGSQRAQ